MGSVDSAGVVVAAAFGVGGILAAVEEILTSSGEAEISDSEVVEFSEGGAVEAAEVLAFTDVLMALFMEWYLQWLKNQVQWRQK